MFKLLAMLRGFREAFDVEDGSLVVFRESDGIWIHAPNAWKLAALYGFRAEA